MHCTAVVSTQLFGETAFSIFSADEFWGRKVWGNFEIFYKTAHCHILKNSNSHSHYLVNLTSHAVVVYVEITLHRKSRF